MALLLRLINWAKRNKLIILITFAGFLIRILGTRPGVYSEGDEVFYGQAVNMILHKNLLIETQYMGYPPLVYWIFLVFFLFIFIPSAWFIFAVTQFQDFLLTAAGIYKGAFGGMVGFDQIFNINILGPRWVNAMYWGRYTTSLFGAGVIYLTFRIAESYFKDKRVAFLASLFVALNFRMALNSMIGFPDMYNAFFLLLSFKAVKNLIDKPSRKNYILAFISAALSFLVKYQTYALIPLFISHLSISLKYAKGNLKLFFVKMFSKNVIIGGLISITIVVVSHIQYFIEWERVSAINSYEAVKYGFGVNSLNIHPISYLYHLGVGPLFSILGLLGIMLGLLKRRFRFLTLLLFSPFPIFAYLYFYYTIGGYHTRNLISLIPIFLIFASYAISEILNVLTFIFKPKYLLFATQVLLLAIILTVGLKDHLKNIFITVNSYSKVPSNVILNDWLDENIKGDVVYGYYPSNPTPSDPVVKGKLLGPVTESFSYQELVEDGVDFATIDISNVVEPSFLWWMVQAPEIGLKFWNKPDNLLSQNYMALATRELLWNHSLSLEISPWQTASLSYAVVKITKPEELLKNLVMKKIKTYDPLLANDWIPLFYLDRDKNLLSKCNQLVDKTGCLIITGGSLPGSVRWETQSLSIKPGYVYKVVGTARNSIPTPKISRNGFLRLDFYNEIPSHTITSRPSVSFVSKRIYGDGKWASLEVDAIAPSGAKYLVIGFQADNSTEVLLKDLVVSESSSKLEERPVTHYTISDGELFTPNNVSYK